MIYLVGMASCQLDYSLCQFQNDNCSAGFAMPDYHRIVHVVKKYADADLWISRIDRATE